MGGTIGGVVFFVLVVCGVCVCCSANDNLGAQVKRQQHPGSVLVGGPWEDVTAQGVATENPLQHAIHPVAVPAHHSGAWSARDMMMDDEGRVWVRPGGGGAVAGGGGGGGAGGGGARGRRGRGCRPHPPWQRPGGC